MAGKGELLDKPLVGWTVKRGERVEYLPPQGHYRYELAARDWSNSTSAEIAQALDVSTWEVTDAIRQLRLRGIVVKYKRSSGPAPKKKNEPELTPEEIARKEKEKFYGKGCKGCKYNQIHPCHICNYYLETGTDKLPRDKDGNCPSWTKGKYLKGKQDWIFGGPTLW